MICKRITNFGGEKRIKEFDKYEFEINIITRKESLDNNAEKTIIVSSLTKQTEFENEIKQKETEIETMKNEIICFFVQIV